MLPMTGSTPHHESIPDPWSETPSRPEPFHVPAIDLSQPVLAAHPQPEEPLLEPATPLDTPEIVGAAATSRPSSSTRADQILLQDEVKVKGFAKTPLGRLITKALALLWLTPAR